MKFTDILQSATSNMMRSKVRTLLTITAIVIGAFTITLTVGISSGISDYLDKQVGSIGAKDILIVQPKVEFESGSGPQKYNPDKKSVNPQTAMLGSMMDNANITAIQAIPGVIKASPMLFVAPEYAVGKNGEKYVLPVQTLIESTNIDFIAGAKPSNPAAAGIILPTAYVRALGYSSAQQAVGQTITFTIKNPAGVAMQVPATISGVQQESIITAGSASGNATLINQLHDIQTEGLPVEVVQQYPAVIAQFDTSDNNAKLAGIKQSLTDKGLEGQTVDDQIGILKQVINAITYVLIFFGAIALLAASFGIINTLFMSVQERTKEIGLMKAMGMSRFKVFLLFSVEAILLGFWGSFIGVALAFGVGQIANKVASENFLKDLPGFDLTVFPIIPVLTVMVVVMLIALLSGTLPARRAAKQDPIDALRYE